MIADDALTHAALRALFDPDPDPAFRYRPFVLQSTRAAGAAPPVPLRWRVGERWADALAAAPRFGPITRPTIASHRPACC